MLDISWKLKLSLHNFFLFCKCDGSTWKHNRNKCTIIPLWVFWVITPTLPGDDIKEAWLQDNPRGWAVTALIEKYGKTHYHNYVIQLNELWHTGPPSWNDLELHEGAAISRLRPGLTQRQHIHPILSDRAYVINYTTEGLTLLSIRFINSFWPWRQVRGPWLNQPHYDLRPFLVIGDVIPMYLIASLNWAILVS